MTEYTPQEYLLILRTKTALTCRILVEGKSDQIAFENLRYDLGIDRNLVEVDSAERLVKFEESDGALGNRAKVERICDLLAAEVEQITETTAYPYQENFVGFVDRELREFEIDSNIRDRLESHLVSNRLVWTRGHSIENYFFDPMILADAFRPHILDRFEENLNLFQRIFPSVIRLAAAITILRDSARDFRNFSLVSWESLEVTGNEIGINPEHWRSTLQTRNLRPAQVDSIVETYINLQAIVSSWDYSITRWMIHGHAGLHVIKHSIARCAGDNGYSPAQISSIISNPNNEKDASCIVAWIHQLRDPEIVAVYPLLVFDLLRIQYSL